MPHDSKKTFLPGETKTIIIDAGHGSPDGGAVGSSGVLEKDLNLSIAKKLQEFAEQGGFNVILTRSDDNGIYDISGNIRSKKNSDLKNREKLIKNSKADAFVSIHMNKFPQSKYSGPQVFYSGNNEKSKDLAEYIQESVIEALTPVSKREIKKADPRILRQYQRFIQTVIIPTDNVHKKEETNMFFKKKQVEAFETVTIREISMRTTEEYQLICKGDLCDISMYQIIPIPNSHDDDRVLVQSDEYSTRDLVNLMNECGFASWDGFSGKHPKNVCDGIMFTVNAVVNSGKTVKASGSENFPKHYKRFMGEIKGLLYPKQT